MQKDKSEDFESWRAFARVAALGSMSKAALDLAVEPSSISRRIDGLESELQLRLLVRGPRNCSLTEDGVRAYAALQPILQDFRSAIREMRAQSSALEGLIRVSAVVGLGDALIAWLGEFQRRHPAVDFDLSLNEAPGNVIREKCDLAIWADLDQNRHIEYQSLGEIPSLICAAPAYLARHPPVHRCDDLDQHTLLACTSWIFPLRLVQLSSGETRPFGGARRFSFNSIAALRSAALQGLGIAIGLPSYACQRDLGAGRLQHVLPAYQAPRLHFRMMSPASRFQPLRVGQLKQWIVECWQRDLAPAAATYSVAPPNGSGALPPAP